MKRIFVPTVSGSDWQRFLGKPELKTKPEAFLTYRIYRINENA